MPESSSICGLTGETRVGPTPDPDPDPTIHDAVATWIERSLNVVYDREDSAKETTNPKSNNPNPKGSRSGSHRFSVAGSSAAGGSTNLKAEGPIIGLPARIRHVACPSSRRQAPPNTNSRIFPKRKKSVPEAEPTSPKVSCFGKVLSDRERTKNPNPKRIPKPNQSCWVNFTGFFGACVGGQQKMLRSDDDVAEIRPIKFSLGKRPVGPPEEETMSGPTPGLGKMVRFASGRRSESWASECEFEIDREAVLARRSVGSIQDGYRETG